MLRIECGLSRTYSNTHFCFLFSIMWNKKVLKHIKWFEPSRDPQLEAAAVRQVSMSFFFFLGGRGSYKQLPPTTSWTWRLKTLHNSSSSLGTKPTDGYCWNITKSADLKHQRCLSGISVVQPEIWPSFAPDWHSTCFPQEEWVGRKLFTELKVCFCSVLLLQQIYIQWYEPPFRWRFVSRDYFNKPAPHSACCCCSG